MEPITQYAAGRALDRVVDILVRGVFAACSRRRAQAFLETFLEELKLSPTPEGEERINAYLDRIARNELESEILFESYRRVALSKSKTLGPKVCALLTATLLSEGRELLRQAIDEVNLGSNSKA